VESWHHGDDAHPGNNGAHPDFKMALPPPPPDVHHVEIHVRLKPGVRDQDSGIRSQETGIRRQESVTSSLSPDPCPLTPDAGGPEISAAQWQDLEALWKGILGLEATVDALRASMESLLNEMESSLRRSLTIEEKSYALRADVTQWERAKTRLQFALPKMRDFIHRAVWALGAPERKRLDEVHKDHIQPHVPVPQMNQLLKQLEDLRKDRQILSELGRTVHQECKGISANVQGALRTLQNNAVNAQRKKSGGGSKGRFLK
jgi:hypothetical protein